jgi:hypothetical protein
MNVEEESKKRFKFLWKSYKILEEKLKSTQNKNVYLENKIKNMKKEQEHEQDKIKNKLVNRMSKKLNSRLRINPFAILKMLQTQPTNVKFSNLKSTSMLWSHREPEQFFIVIDTNILISNLGFIKEIKGKTFKGKLLAKFNLACLFKFIDDHSTVIGKAIIYLPFIVLDELDVLKTPCLHLQNKDESVAIHARRANSFIDKCLTSKDAFLTGESRVDNESLIPINSPDDEVLNCCLKLKKISSKILLLSNDKNLRNKANLSRVTAYSSKMLKDSKFESIKLY